MSSGAARGEKDGPLCQSTAVSKARRGNSKRKYHRKSWQHMLKVELPEPLGLLGTAWVVLCRHPLTCFPEGSRWQWVQQVVVVVRRVFA